MELRKRHGSGGGANLYALCCCPYLPVICCQDGGGSCKSARLVQRQRNWHDGKFHEAVHSELPSNEFCGSTISKSECIKMMSPKGSTEKDNHSMEPGIHKCKRFF